MTDWTDGEPLLLYGECRACGQRWALPRERCPRCGSDKTSRRPSSGRGTVVAVTVVHRAPGGDVHPPTPFGLCLVVLAEGVRVMGRADPALAVGDHVTVAFPAGVPEFHTTSGPEG